MNDLSVKRMPKIVGIKITKGDGGCSTYKKVESLLPHSSNRSFGAEVSVTTENRWGEVKGSHSKRLVLLLATPRLFGHIYIFS